MGFYNDAAQSSVVTTDATQTQALSYDLPSNSVPDNSIINALIKVSGFDSSLNACVIEKLYAVKRGTGDCTIIGETTIAEIKDISLITADAVLNVDGSALEIDVTGVLLTDLTWEVRLEFLAVYAD
jgi:hypothetical protein